MTKILKNMKGKVFASFEKDKSVDNQSYGVLRINLEDVAILLKNAKEIAMLEDETVPYEEATRFSCCQTKLSSPYLPELVDVGI